MEDRNKKILEFVVATLIILILAFLAWDLLRNKTKPGEQPSTSEVKKMPTASETFTPEEIKAAHPDASVNARIFAERFGSFSNQNSYGNITDVLAIATPAMQTKLRGLIGAAKAELSEKYYGISTRVTGMVEKSRTDGAVVLEISTQREEATGNPGNVTTRYQKILVTMQKVGDDWLVGDYAWE